MDDKFLRQKLDERKSINAFRQLRVLEGYADFCSNDYLGIATSGLLSRNAHNPLATGSAGSRLLAGNSRIAEQAEEMIASFHEASAGLLFNSGYDANLGLMSCLTGRGDTVIYDYLSHASLRDGIRLGLANSFSFRHNDLDDLEKKLNAAQGKVFVVTESVFSMDGDIAPLKEIADLCERFGAALIIDEAHATGVTGPGGAGLVQEVGLQDRCFARIHTFGKALGCHGGIVLGSGILRDYLINFSRPFIYTTALPPSSVRHIIDAYALFPSMERERIYLADLITYFRSGVGEAGLSPSCTAIQPLLIPGNDEVRKLAADLQASKLDVRPILYPTVPKGSERLRIVLHASNTKEEVTSLIAAITHHRYNHSSPGIRHNPE